jgi:hypothetical protein
LYAIANAQQRELRANRSTTRIQITNQNVHQAQAATRHDTLLEPIGRGQAAQWDTTYDDDDDDNLILHEHQATPTARIANPKKHDEFRQWSNQPFPPVYANFGSKCSCYIGNFANNCSSSPPPKEDLLLLQPGSDGSHLDLSTTAQTPYSSTDHDQVTALGEPLLTAVANFCSQRLLHKLYHSQSTKSYNRSLRLYLNDKYVDTTLKNGIIQYAPNYNRAVTFLQRMGAQV